MLIDVLLAAVILIMALSTRIEMSDPAFGDVYLRDADWFHTLLIVLMSAPLALRRIYPASVFGVILVAWMLDAGWTIPSRWRRSGPS